MPGTFSKANRPARPGAYTNFQAAAAEPQLGSTVGTVLVPFTHTWGPSNTVVELSSFGEFLSIFGRGSDDPSVFTEGYKAVHDAFRGEGFGGRQGAGTVLAYRLAGDDADKGALTLQNTDDDDALTVTARYDGDGYDLKAQVVVNAADSGAKNDLVIYDGTVEIERWTHVKANLDDLAAAVNAGSNWVTADSLIDGTALATTGSPGSLTGGDDGVTLVSDDWVSFLAAAESNRFGLFAPANLTDGGILASVVAWAQGLNTRGKRFVTVVGGEAGEEVATAITRSGTINDPNFVNLGGGTYNDSKFGELSTAQLAPRVAGILAAAGEAQSITFKRLAGLDITVGATDAEIIAGLSGGVVTIARDSHPDAPTRLEKALTTFTTSSDVARPLSIFSSPKFVRIMQGLELDFTEDAEANCIGRLPINDSTREYLVGRMAAKLAAREAAGIIHAGWTVDVDQDPPPSDDDEFVALVYSVGFGRSLEQVYNTVVVG